MGDRPVMLVADDDEMNRNILDQIFAEDFEIFEAENGQEVLDLLARRNGAVDIILLDIQMPKLDGYQVLEQLKQNAAYSKIPVIANTQFDNEDNEIRALKLGAIEFISKPYNPVVIRHRVHNVMEKTVLEHAYLKETLNDTNDRIRSLINSVPGGIATCIVSNKIELEYFNDTYCTLCGYTRDNYPASIKENPLSLVIDEDRHIITEAIHDARINRSDFKASFRVRQANGNIIWLSMTAARYKEKDGVPIYHIVLMDVTEDHKQEERLKESYRELKFRTERDALTGVYNREMFVKMASQMLHKSVPLSTKSDYYIVYSDIANFKLLNELAGTDVGDEVLKRIAAGLREKIKGQGVYGRWGADNFAALLSIHDFPIGYVCEYLEQLLHNTKIKYNVKHYFGLYRIDNINLPVDQMCDRANMALKTIKGSFIRNYAFYDDQMRNDLLEEQLIISEMEEALAQHQFCAYFQPIYSADSAEPVSAEALVRWIHPVKGLIAPNKFIPVFEKTGFITKLDYYIWEYTCNYISERLKAGDPVVPVSVNVSRRNLYNPEICDQIIELVDRYGLTPSMLKLEITETAYNDNPVQLSNMVQRLQDKGFSILMDDFGSGYSSLNMLKDLPVDILKIDMKFMENLTVSLRANNMIISIIHMAKRLNMKVVTEGVETESQLRFLRANGCDMIQGYYYSRPIPADEFTKRLQNEIKG